MRAVEEVAAAAAASVVAAASMAAAILWGVHPIQAEVVGWASAQPYAPAAFFCLASTHMYLDYLGVGCCGFVRGDLPRDCDARALLRAAWWPRGIMAVLS